MPALTIKPYAPGFQSAINEMMKLIQDEYAEAITTHHSTVIKDVYKEPDQKFWVALGSDDQVAGTIGIKIGKGFSEIKRMFVHPSYRGPQFPSATLLLTEAISHARKIGSPKVYLGTMTQFKAAQRFYGKTGFTEINKEDLPPDYKLNPMDSIFYVQEL